MDITTCKKNLCQLAETYRPVFHCIAQELHSHPELGGQEYFASGLLLSILGEHDFQLLPTTPEFPTALHAARGTGPVQIGFLAEYDALPRLGHACGHNLIAAMSTLAALCSAEVLGELATIHVFGCPAEETLGSKVALTELGYFNDLDAALICHPSGETSLGGTSYATHPLRITFLGKSAHVADPDYHGINALDALVDFYTRLTALEQTFTEPHILGKIITEGGTAPNIIPERATIKATIRALRVEYLETTMLPAIRELAHKVAKAHGTQLELEHYEPLFKNLLNDKVLENYMETNLHTLGITSITRYSDNYADGSTDVGNVSHVAPTIQPEIQIGQDIYVHTSEFAAAAISDYGLAMAFKAAKALALTAADVVYSRHSQIRS